MEDKIHFKITHGGVTRRFALSHGEDNLISALKTRVLKIIGTDTASLYWKDEDSLIVLDSDDDLKAAIDYAETKNKLACVSLVAEADETYKKEVKQSNEIKVVTSEESQTAFNGYIFMCDSCDCFLAPSNGGRFKCTICDNYDLCAACIAKGDHDNHAFIHLLNAETEVPLSNEVNGSSRMFTKNFPGCTPIFVAKLDDRLKGTEKIIIDVIDSVGKQVFDTAEWLKNATEKMTLEAEIEEQKMVEEIIRHEEEEEKRKRKKKEESSSDRKPEETSVEQNAPIETVEEEEQSAADPTPAAEQPEEIATPATTEAEPVAVPTADQPQTEEIPLAIPVEQQLPQQQTPQPALQPLQQPQSRQVMLQQAQFQQRQPIPVVLKRQQPLQSQPVPQRQEPQPQFQQRPQPMLHPQLQERRPHQQLQQPQPLPRPHPQTQFRERHTDHRTQQHHQFRDRQPHHHHQAQTHAPHQMRHRNERDEGRRGFWLYGGRDMRGSHGRYDERRDDTFHERNDRERWVEEEEPRRNHDDYREERRDRESRNQGERREGDYGRYDGQRYGRNEEERREEGRDQRRRDQYVDLEGDYHFGRGEDHRNYDRERRETREERGNRSEYENYCRDAGYEDRYYDRENEEERDVDRGYGDDYNEDRHERQEERHEENRRNDDESTQRQSRQPNYPPSDYQVASQIPAHMTIAVIEELESMTLEEMKQKLAKYTRHLKNNVYDHEPHPVIFCDQDYYGEDDEYLIGNIAVDLRKHLSNILKYIQECCGLPECLNLLEERRNYLREALTENEAYDDEYRRIAVEVRPIILTSQYTSSGTTGRNWDMMYVGFMDADALRGYRSPPRVASFDPLYDGLFSPRPINCDPYLRD